MLPLQGTSIQALTGALRSCMPCHVAQPKKKRKGKKRDMVECSLDEAVNYVILLFNFIEEDLSKT